MSAFIFASFCVAATIGAAPGDLQKTVTLTGLSLSDLAVATDTSVWAVGTTDGKVYHLTSALVQVPADTRDHPFGAASPMPPFQPVCRGIAFVQGALMVLNSSTGQVWRMSTSDGSPVGSAVTLQAPAGSSLASLSYDSSDSTLWAVDSEGDRVLGFDPTTGVLKKTCAFPGDTPPETPLYGTGVEFATEGASRFLYVLWGDIFQERALTVRLLVPGTCAVDPFSVPLGAVGDGDIKGLAAQTGKLLVLLGRGADAVICVVDRNRPSVLSPSDLVCGARATGDVDLSWKNNGTGANGAYTEISIARNGTAIAQLSGAAQAYTDQDAPSGELAYEIKARQGVSIALPARCSLWNKRGAILSWIPFQGGSISGVAVDPDTGEVWVTDAKPVSAGRYALWHYTPELALINTIEISAPGPIYGITFWPNSPFVTPPETLLMIGNESTNTVQKLRKDGSVVGGSVPLRLPQEDGEPDPKVGSLAHDPGNGLHFLAVLDRANKRIVWVNQNGFPADSGATDTKIVCTPPGTSGIVPEFGLDRSPASGFMQVGIASGSVHEVDDFCNVTPFDLDPHLPNGPRSSITCKDFAYGGNSLYCASPATNVLYRVLAYPVGSPFVRGNSNGDQTVNIADAVAVLQYLFERGPAPTCPDSADANDDGKIDVSDPVYLLFFLFGSGPPPPDPYPDPAVDPTPADTLTC